MKNIFSCILLYSFCIVLACNAKPIRQEKLFDDGWKFFLGDQRGAEKSSFNDISWRNIDLPHDWSIEKLPLQKQNVTVGPFCKESSGATATGYTLGGTAWYRKTFILSAAEKYDRTIITFDGVYMNCEIWVNGKFVGTHAYGYTAFTFDITNFLHSAGIKNVIAVKVKNEGKNSRWYSGSGIYRHVWLTRKQNINIPQNGVFITTENVTSDKALIKVLSTIHKETNEKTLAKFLITAIDPDGKVVKSVETKSKITSSDEEEFIQELAIPTPLLWSIESPNLYTMNVELVVNDKIVDKVSTTFGIRTIHFDAQKGFTLNGEKVLLKGGCMHHDNGFLGSTAIDRAEERRVQLMKAYGFNAIRTSHNPPSRQFLEACDRNGILVIDEIFDMWERSKNPQDYHLYFKKCWRDDLKSMILRDRNHPSVILWSIGNEINERIDSTGYVIRQKLVEEVKKNDRTRPVTEGLCDFWDHPGKKWADTKRAFSQLDVCGYNYLWQQYESDHKKFPDRIMVGTESYAGEAYDNWMQVQKNLWVIGDFVWTAMDYLGETGVGNSSLDNGPRVGLKPWPWFNAFCGDIDLCGFKKPQLIYKDVVWNESRLEMLVHAPIPEGKHETVSYWGWPDELESWNWKGNEGKMMDIRVFANCSAVRLELNGKMMAEQTINATSKYIANFTIPYEPGVLRAVALDHGIEVASKELITTGNPAKIKLTADRTSIKAERNDLSYVKVEVVDHWGNLVPDAKIPVTFSVSGVGEIAGSGNACPYDMESFNNPVCTTYHGKALVIIRPLKNGTVGEMILHARADGVESGTIIVNTK